MGGLRWYNEDKLPEDVRAAMRDVLAEALREAARKEDPGDGYSIGLTPEKVLGKGMYNGGWKLQSSLVEDVRMNPAPFVVVHAYSDSQITKGSVSADVERSPADRRFLAEKRLSDMVARRDRLNERIDQLRAELG